MALVYSITDAPSFTGSSPQAACTAWTAFYGAYTPWPNKYHTGAWSVADRTCYMLKAPLGSEDYQYASTISVSGTEDPPPTGTPDPSMAALVGGVLLAWALGYVLGFKVRLVKMAIYAA